jgi:ABC-type uncharacterized transport system auxiliary subunit
MKPARLLVVALVLAAAAACLQRTVPATSYFRLTTPECHLRAGQLPYALALIRLQAGAAYEQQAVLYRPSPYRIAPYGYSRWEATPAEMLTDRLQQFLESCHLFRSVTQRGISGRADLMLRGRVTRFEEVDTPEGSFAELAVEFELSCVRGGAQLWQGRLSVRSPMATRNPEELARAMSAATATLFDDLSLKLEAAAGNLEGKCAAPAGKVSK